MSADGHSDDPGQTTVWLGDHLVPVDDALVSVFDAGFRTGEGVFETFRSYGTHPFRLDAHLDRAIAGTAVLGFEAPSRELLATAVRRTAAANHRGRDLGVRLVVTPGTVDAASPFPGVRRGGPTVVVTAQPLDVDPGLYERGIRAALVPFSRELPEVKAVSYLASVLARRQALAAGADEALLTDGSGHVLEGSYSNVFAVVRGRLVTPPVDAGILPGVTRAVVVATARSDGLEVAETPLPTSELRAADEAFVTATTREVVPLVAVDGSPVGDGTPGPVTAAVLDAYRAEVRREIAAQSR